MVVVMVVMSLRFGKQVDAKKYTKTMVALGQ